MKAHPYAVAGLIMGILSYIQLLGLEKSAAAVLFGYLALKKTGKEEETEPGGKKMAYAAVILGVAYVLLLGYILFFRSPVLFP